MGPVSMSNCPSIEDLIYPQFKQLGLYQHSGSSNPTFIPIHLPGGIGDVIMSIDGIKELKKRYQVVIYTAHVEAFKYFYKDFIPVFKSMPVYSWHLEYDTIARFKFQKDFDGFLLKDHQDLFRQQLRTFERNPQLEKLAYYESKKYFLISLYGRACGWNRRDFPMRSLGFDQSLAFEKSSREIVKQYITIHDGYDVSYTPTGRNTKTWYLPHWKKLVQSIRELYPALEIIQLGSTTSRPIEGVTTNLINKTTLTQAFDILAGSKLHIDGDSGLVHAAARMQVPSVVLWGPTPQYFYGYPENKNLRANVCREACYGMNSDWYEKCPLGYLTPKCMDEISPERVLELVKKLL